MIDKWHFQNFHIKVTCHNQILYTALNSPSLIFALWRSETDAPSLAFAHTQIFLHKPLYTIQLAHF